MKKMMMMMMIMKINRDYTNGGYIESLYNHASTNVVKHYDLHY